MDLSSGTVTAAAAGEIFEYSVEFLNGVPVATDGDVTISGFDAAVDRLVIKTESLPSGYAKSSLISGNTAGVDVTQSITDTRIDFGANSAGDSGSITLSGITDSDLSFSYNLDGLYNVNLIAENIYTCKDTSINPLIISSSVVFPEPLLPQIKMISFS